MNPLTLLPLLAAAAMAAPGAHVVYQQPAFGYAQVPLTQTVHYAAQPVVTGYSTTVVKPALAAPIAPIAVQGTPYYTYQYARQLPGLEPPADLPIAPPNGTNPAPPADFPQPTPPGQGGNSSNPAPPIGDAPQPPAIPMLPGAPGAPAPTQPPMGGGGENGTSNDNGGGMGGGSQLPIPGSPILGTPSLLSFVNPGHLQLNPLAYAQNLAVQSSDAVVVQARSLPVAAVRAAQAGDFEPLVTKEKVLAPVRTHTEITPQLTQIQPEISVRKIIHDVPVATPVAVNSPVFHQFV